MVEKIHLAEVLIQNIVTETAKPFSCTDFKYQYAPDWKNQNKVYPYNVNICLLSLIVTELGHHSVCSSV